MATVMVPGTLALCSEQLYVAIGDASGHRIGIGTVVDGCDMAVQLDIERGERRLFLLPVRFTPLHIPDPEQLLLWVP